MGGRVVEGTGFENRQGGNLFVGSNPTPSAILLILWMPHLPGCFFVRGFLLLFPCRLNKFLAFCGVCSRRDADSLIFQKKVRVNNSVVDHPSFLVEKRDMVVVEGKVLQAPSKTDVWIYHKPCGYVTTHRDPLGRPTVFEDVKERYPHLPRLISVGRLDLNSQGLLLLTNSGTFARKAELPQNKWRRCYRVRVRGIIDPQKLDNLKKGCRVDGINYGPIFVDTDILGQSANQWLYVSLFEGKNREIRRVMNHLGLDISRLIRVAYGSYALDDLPPHHIKKVSPLS